MNHLVRTEAKRIYLKIRRNLASADAERISDTAIEQQSISRYNELTPAKSNFQK